MYVSFKPPQAVAYLHEAERKESAPNNRPINLETCCHMRRWVEIKEMEVNRSWTENLGIMWRSVFCCMEVERLTPQTEVEIKINSDLDSTLIPCSACLFFPLHEACGDTKQTLSPQTVKDNISLSSQCQNSLLRKGYPSLRSFVISSYLDPDSAESSKRETAGGNTVS